ncbi:hypothetical protein SAMN02746098_00223 [Desulfosporosinus lacus DSM 15449]|uniref:Uncharacterized protein n=1 Tax=Desulfosporosinus lacus DSM 15449 TaxID=1121420 RepID=A0A1M5QD56_9FIRM|nr:hypothetical protein SAMN02746098_00223 [Desulfosporosinus lacus DSM 15449]
MNYISQLELKRATVRRFSAVSVGPNSIFQLVCRDSEATESLFNIYYKVYLFCPEIFSELSEQLQKIIC